MLYNKSAVFSFYYIQHSLIMIALYKALLTKRSEDYDYLTNLVLNTRVNDEYKVLAVFKDRGSKADYIQSYYYNLFEVDDIVTKTHAEGKWFVSLYLSWFLHETGVTQNDLSISFDTFCLFVENNLYRRIIETNRYECYGFCMCALTLLDKEFLLKANADEKIVLQKLAIEGIVTYLYNHVGINLLWDAEMYSSYARLFDRFRADMTMILLDFGLDSYAQYSYCYGMYKAFECAPIECSYKLEYHKNALMMQQNQTVVAVTQDSMDAGLGDAVSFGEAQFMGFTTKMLQYDIVEEYSLKGLRNYIHLLNSQFNERVSKEPGFENIRCLERYFQLEPYDKKGYIEPPYKRTFISAEEFLDILGIKMEDCDIRKTDNGDDLIITQLVSLFPKFHKMHDYYKIESTYIRYMKLIVRPDGSICSIYVVGNKLYELYRDISNSGLFYNIPCVVGLWAPYFEGGMDSINLMVGTNYDFSHGFK